MSNCLVFISTNLLLITIRCNSLLVEMKVLISYFLYVISYYVIYILCLIGFGILYFSYKLQISSLSI